MPRPQISVVRASAEHEQGFTALWMQARVEGGATPDWAARAGGNVPYQAAAAREDVRLYLAIEREPGRDSGTVVGSASDTRHEGRVPAGPDRAVGFAVVTQGPTSGLTEMPPAVWIDELYVAPGSRRRGVGKALLAAVARYAEITGAPQIVGAVSGSQRESSRFFARLGFTSSVVCRCTATASLRRRLAPADEQQHVTVVAGRTVAARRRTLRARSTRLLGTQGAGR